MEIVHQSMESDRRGTVKSLALERGKVPSTTTLSEQSRRAHHEDPPAASRACWSQLAYTDRHSRPAAGGTPGTEPGWRMTRIRHIRRTPPLATQRMFDRPVAAKVVSDSETRPTGVYVCQRQDELRNCPFAPALANWGSPCTSLSSDRVHARSRSPRSCSPRT